MQKKYLDLEGLGEVAYIVNHKCKQVSLLPYPSASEAGKIYQYIGKNTSLVRHGWFYECVQSESDPSVYQWAEKDVQRNDDVPHVTGTVSEINSKILYNQIPDGAYVGIVDDWDDSITNGLYSLKETLTGETWIDDKPIYRLVITTVLPEPYIRGGSSYRVYVPTGIAAGVIDTLVGLQTNIHHYPGQSNEYWFDSTYMTFDHYRNPSTSDTSIFNSSNITIDVFVRDAGTNIDIQNGGTWYADQPVNIILKYTKTTD